MHAPDITLPGSWKRRESRPRAARSLPPRRRASGRPRANVCGQGSDGLAGFGSPGHPTRRAVRLAVLADGAATRSPAGPSAHISAVCGASGRQDRRRRVPGRCRPAGEGPPPACTDPVLTFAAPRRSTPRRRGGHATVPDFGSILPASARSGKSHGPSRRDHSVRRVPGPGRSAPGSAAAVELSGSRVGVLL